MRPRNVKFQNHNENADRHLFACALRWRPFYTPEDFTVTANPSKSARELGWKAELGLEDMCRDAWNWQKKNPNGYEV